MKVFWILSVSILMLSTQVIAQGQQENYPLMPCDNDQVHKNLVVANEKQLNNQGKLTMFQLFEVPNDVFVPILISLEEGKRYALNLSVDPGYKVMEFAVIDGDKTEVVKHKSRNRKGDSVVTQKVFTAKETGMHWLIVSQKVGKKASNCVGVSLIELN